jgi:hypothetical protein
MTEANGWLIPSLPSAKHRPQWSGDGGIIFFFFCALARARLNTTVKGLVLARDPSSDTRKPPPSLWTAAAAAYKRLEIGNFCQDPHIKQANELKNFLELKRKT